MSAKKVLKVQNSAELLSYIINQNPILSKNIDLPVQGQNINEIGKIILNNQRYRNAFINTVNLIGLTVIKRNSWTDPWNFTNRGTLNYGQQVREIINDISNIYDYNENSNNVTKFLENAVPNVFNYIHEINFQKFYETTTSDAQLKMAFESGDLFSYIDNSISMLYESYVYDNYLINKYQLARRIVDGTITPVDISNFDNISARERVAAMKNISNKMTFRSPNYNPAGIRRASSFDEQIFILNTDFEASLSTEVLATSYFRDEADFKARCVLVDGFGNFDINRLTEVLGSDFTPFTETEINQLNNIPAVIISKEFFMNYDYAIDIDNNFMRTEFFNPTTLKNNHYLHIWKIYSTSPFENAVVFNANIEPAINNVSVSPATATLSIGSKMKLNADVSTTGFANKSVFWHSSDNSICKVNENGEITLTSGVRDSEVIITATSIFDNSKSGTCTITIA